MRAWALIGIGQVLSSLVYNEANVAQYKEEQYKYSKDRLINVAAAANGRNGLNRH